jgi:hypothetical protein
MPTVTIDSNLTDPFLRRRLARRLTLALGKSGISVGRVAIRWRSMDRPDVFTGPLSLDDREPDGDAYFAFISVEIDHNRDREWRSSLLETLYELCSDFFRDRQLFLRLEPVDPNDYRNAVHHPQALNVEAHQ